MRKLLSTAALMTGLISAPAAIAQEDMSCAAFIDLAETAQADALSSLDSISGAGGADQAEEDTTPGAQDDAALPADESASAETTEMEIGTTDPQSDEVAMVANDVSAEDVAQICRDNANLTVLEAVGQAQDAASAATQPATQD